jgi:hypothetical protein
VQAEPAPVEAQAPKAEPAEPTSHPAKQPAEPASTAGIGDEKIGFGKHTEVLVKDIFAKDPGRVNWLIDNASNSRAKVIANYLKTDPAFLASRKARAEASAAGVSPEAKATLDRFGITATPQQDGTVKLEGKQTYDFKDTIIKPLGGRWDNPGWALPAEQLQAFVAHLAGVPGTDRRPRNSTATYLTDPELRRLRDAADGRPDTSQFTGPVESYLGPGTADLIRQDVRWRSRVNETGHGHRAWHRRDRRSA